MSSSEEEANGQRETIDGEEEQQGQATPSVKTDDDAMAETQGSDHGKSNGDKDATKEKLNENVSPDLDKDIDALVSYNVQTGLVDPDGSNIENITVDTGASSTLNIDPDMDGGFEEENAEDGQDLNGNISTTAVADGHTIEQLEITKDPVEVTSEKSFASDTDSSAIAEVVVKNVISKAVDVVKSSGTEVCQEPEKAQLETGSKKDFKVGLFQYQDDEEEDDDDGDDDGESDSDVDMVEQQNTIESDRKEPVKDYQVGLFQYADMEISERSKSPEVSEMDENEDDVIESMNEEEQANIMRLYGLDIGPVLPISPKSASPSENDVSSQDEKAKEQNLVIDVQRQVYEPVSRSFSVNRDPSSSESTPRLEEARSRSDTGEQEDEINVEENNVKDNGEKELFTGNETGTDNDQNGVQNMGRDAQHDLKATETGDIKDKTVSSMSPPLIQYESVTENGKFRIIKTSKEGGGIRVGADVFSPKESPKQSPRDTASSEDEKAGSVKSFGGYEGQSSSEVPSANQKKGQSLVSNENKGQKVEEIPSKPRENIPAVPNDEKKYEQNGTLDSVLSSELDTSKIRALIAKENENQSTGASSKDQDLRRIVSGREDSSGRRSPQQLSVSELQSSIDHDRQVELDSDVKSKYMSSDRYGLAERRSRDSLDDGDRLASDSRYLEIQEQQPSYNRSRYTLEDSGSQDSSRSSSKVGTKYESELLQSAYDRVSHQPESRVPGPPKSHDTGVIPGFKTLQQQQVKWSDMFHSLEEEHRRDLRSQYERHQYNIQRLQQQMEHELQKQHLAIRKKLDIHKEALAKMSPERESTTRRCRSPDGTLSPERSSRSPERSTRSRERSTERSTERSGADDLSTLQSSFESKSWREIYREVREEEEDRSTSSSRPLKRSLDSEFDTLERSRPSEQRSSPREIQRSSPRDLERSGGRGRSYEKTTTDRKYSKAERERSFGSDRRRSPERSFERERSPEGQASRSGDGVSRHVKQLLDNLNDSRHSLRGLQEGERERPRAGVYSSPMPMPSRGDPDKSLERPRVDLSASRESGRLSHVVTDQSRSSILPGDRAEMYEDRRGVDTYSDRRRPVDLEMSQDSTRSDESFMSHSTRMNLREKHSKHLADLRAYYEDELRELRKALSATLEGSTASANVSVQSTVNYHLLDAENKHLLDKCRTLEDELEEYQLKVRTVEQKNTGLEKRASEYASAFTDAQTMGIQHRAHIEELQRYCRERDDLINDLESKLVAGEDNVKIYKKNMEEEMDLHRQDKISLQRMVDRYESLEREYKLLQETMTATENKLYETRTDVVELNRTISKLELENKRLGRENDNLRHKVTQSLNLSSLHQSFGSPPSPRDGRQQKKRPTSPSQNSHSKPSNQTTASTDQRMPGFATSTVDWTPSSSQNSKNRPSGQSRSRSERNDTLTSSLRQQDSSSLSSTPKEQRSSKSGKVEESSKGRQSQALSSSRSTREDTGSSREDVSARSKHRPRTAPDVPTRDITPARSDSPSSQADSEVSDYSPLLKAERELFKLRDMMRQAVAVKPSDAPPQPKLRKKFYGSERPMGKDDYTPDLGAPRARKDKPVSSNQSNAAVPKTKNIQTQSKSEKVYEKSTGRKSSANKNDKNEKPRDKLSHKDLERRERTKDREHINDRERENGGDREDRGRRDNSPLRNGADFNSSTRFDIDINEDKRTVTLTPRKGEDQSMKRRNLAESDELPRNGRVSRDSGDQAMKHRNLAESGNQYTGNRGHEAGEQSRDGEPNRRATQNGTSQNDGHIENTLEMMRAGQYTTRPGWENVYTSMAKPRQESQQEKNRLIEQRVRERLQSITEMESRYDGLQAEKVQLESNINKIPLHGRVDRQNRQHKEELEERLDSVVKELGSLRMSLKRYNVLKTAG